MIQEILKKVPEIVQVIALLGMAVTIVATLIARITVTPKDDEVAGKFGAIVVKLIKWLPTVGMNPHTAKLEEAYAELKAKEAEKVDASAPKNP